MHVNVYVYIGRGQKTNFSYPYDFLMRDSRENFFQKLICLIGTTQGEKERGTERKIRKITQMSK